ncbi:MAG: M14 family metallopeptidase [Bacteroidetes bacterium]|nr:M14 family metallopeptidase [Bacteroidota bacterium]
MKSIFSVVFFLFVFALSAQIKTTFPVSLLLVPEKTNFEKTSTYADVMSFLNAIKQLSPYISLHTIGKSTQGMDIPMAVLANPMISNADQAKASGKPVIYIQANIHAGEVEGKEVAMMLMRDILLGDKMDLLQNQIIIFVPIYNVDGNDKMEKGLRASQENSPLETGTRENGQGLDLNRDGVKMEAPETKGMITNVLNLWDPQLTVDLHTTNGTWHGYSLTWAPGYLSSGESGPYNYLNEVMLPLITKNAKEKYDLNMGPFGDFSTREGWPLKNFYTYNHHPRYIINQIGLRNRMSILSESFAHERFYQRIHSTYHFVYEILNHCNNHSEEIVKINKQAEWSAIEKVKNQAGTLKKGVRFKMVPTEKPLQHFRTYDYEKFLKEDGTTTLLRTGKIVYYDNITYFAAFKDTVSALLPRGYIIPAGLDTIVEILRKQGVKVTTLEKNQRFSGESFFIEKWNKSPRKFEGHYMVSVEGTFNAREMLAKKGNFIVDMAQPLANLIFYMLEPQSDDGLLSWNFFDLILRGSNVPFSPVDYPVFKYF